MVFCKSEEWRDFSIFIVIIILFIKRLVSTFSMLIATELAFIAIISNYYLK